MRSKRLLIGLLAVALLAVVAIGTASAEKKSGAANTYYDQFVNRVASLLGKQPSEVRTALTTAEKDVIDKAVSDGKLSAQRAARLKTRIDQTGRVVFPIRREGQHRLFRLVARELGMTPKQLRADLASGKSVAQIAGPQKTQALLAKAEEAIKARIDNAVTRGWISKDKASQVEARLRARLQCLVNSHDQGHDCASSSTETSGK